MQSVDLITLEVIRGSFNSTVAQMRATLIRTAYAPVLAFSGDFSCGLLSPKGEVIGMSEDFAGHVFAMSLGLVPSLQKFGDNIYPGDVIMMNDPYIGGTHLNDVVFYTPFFAEGRILVFIAVRTHWLDIGGATAGSFNGRAREIFEEGIRIPPVKIIEKGERNRGLWDVLFANVRLSEERQGDALAMLDTARVAEMRLSELVAKYGPGTIEKCRDAICDGAERVMRQQIAKLPKGEYYYEHYQDNDGMSAEPIPIKVRVKIEDDSMLFDFNGTVPRSKGPVNGGPPIAPAAVFVIVKSWLDPKTPVNGGSFRPLKFVLPEGTIMKATYPSAVGACWEMFRSIQGAIIGLFSQIMPEKPVADVFGSANQNWITGFDPLRNQHFILYEYPYGGYPATGENDGSTASKWCDVSGVCVYPAESAEQRQPVLMEGLEARTDGEGAGFHRSSFGVVRKIKVLGDCQLSVVAEKVVIPPFGVSGGFAGSLNEFTVVREGVEIDPAPEVPGKIKSFPLKAGDLVIVKSSGGGGVGDPLTRNPELVERDIADGYLSLERAQNVYGVVIEDGKVNLTRTEKLRQQLCKHRHHLKVVNSETDIYDSRGLRICMISRQDAKEIGLANGDLVEYVPKVGASCRAWVRINHDVRKGDLPLGPRGRTMLKVEPGELLEIRALPKGRK